MSSGDDIRAGDCVVCVEASGIRILPPLKKGRLYRVAQVSAGVDWNGKWGLGVCVTEIGITYELYNAERFRKIEPAEDFFSKAIKRLLPLESVT